MHDQPYFSPRESAASANARDYRVARGTRRSIDPTTTLRADAFTLTLPDGWTNDTVYAFNGPTVNNHAHRLTITVTPDVGDTTLVEFADRHVATELEETDDAALLDKDYTELRSGQTAYRARLSESTDDDPSVLRMLYFVVSEAVGYQLTASYTQKTRETVGASMIAAMKSFQPHRPLRRRR